MPEWNGGQHPKLVLLDGEGLGHTPKSVAAISTSLTRRIESTDAIVLVDNATIPMQAAPVAAMREMITTGSARKLLLVFTHFDEVKGDNLPNAILKMLRGQPLGPKRNVPCFISHILIFSHATAGSEKDHINEFGFLLKISSQPFNKV